MILTAILLFILCVIFAIEVSRAVAQEMLWSAIALFIASLFTGSLAGVLAAIAVTQ